MSGEIPFFIEGRVAQMLSGCAYIKVDNGNVYVINPLTPGLNFKELELGQKIMVEITNRLTRVFSAYTIDK